MLVRIILENIFSFGERKEFNMIPYTRLQTLEHHKYNILNFEVLKMASLYGANGAGKSNLIKALDLFKRLIVKEEIPLRLRNSEFKFQTESKNQLFEVEFIQDDMAFYYGIELSKNIIVTEELYQSGLGSQEDKLIYKRQTTMEGQTEITFLPEFENNEKGQLLKSILIEEFVKPNEPILKLISNRDNEHLKNVKKAYEWFNTTLQIITPDSKPSALAHKIDIDLGFKKYAEDTMCSFNIGITSLVTEKKEISDFLGRENEEEIDKLIKKVEDSPHKMVGLRSRGGDEIVVVKENDKIWAKQLKIGHSAKKDENVMFELEEESDGTVRLLDFIPAFRDVVSKSRVFIIDEIERSIHPLLIKELVNKFSGDENTKGQLIFSTHESNLLDQEIFRQDEIWFVEKNKNASTEIYPLSDYKEHKTIDIRKGYLNGRYGSIPFLSNLKDLNWHKYDIKE